MVLLGEKMIKSRKFLLSCRNRILSSIFRMTVDLSSTSFISMNCIGGIMYIDAKTQFMSPTVGLFFLPDDFIRFVDNLDYYLAQVPVVTMGEKFPVGKIDDITINFMHYATPEEALNKWERRKRRINKENIFILMVERDGFTDENFEDFKKIKYPKLLYTKSEKYAYKDSVFFRKYKAEPQIPDLIPKREMYYKWIIAKRLRRINRDR